MLLTTTAQLHRQFAIAQYLYNNISEEDKNRLLFDPETGRWSGYKHPYGFKVRTVAYHILSVSNPFADGIYNAAKSCRA